MFKGLLLGGVVAASTVFAAPALAGAGVASGKLASGGTWTATSYLVGQTSTATLASGGSPIYTAAYPQYSGTVGILMNYGAAGSFVCSGTLLNDRRSILTAGHCVSGGAGTANPISTTVFFRGPGSTADTYVYPNAGVIDPSVVTREVSNYFVNPLYTGQVIDQNDIAVLRLSDLAPAFAASYDIYTQGDLTGMDFNIAGYGTRSLVGGAAGTTGAGAGAGVGRLRVGDNRYDYRVGDSDFGGQLIADLSTGGDNAAKAFSFLSDFDNGLAANDASCILATSPNPAVGYGLAASAKYCNLGRGASEVSTAGGDSGGPQFINGMISSVTSYGLTFGTANGDFDAQLNSSWGEFNGFVPTYIHAAFIRGVLVPTAGVPEAATWAQMILGFGLLGGLARRTRKTTKTVTA